MKYTKHLFVVGIALLFLLHFCVYAEASLDSVPAQRAEGMIVPAADIRLTEYQLDENGQEIPYENDKLVVPGQCVDKIVRITNEDSPVWIRVRVEYDRDDVLTGIGDTMLGGIEEDWVKRGDYFYYKKPLNRAESADFLSELRLPYFWDELTSGARFSVRITVQAVLSENFNADFDRDEPWFGRKVDFSVDREQVFGEMRAEEPSQMEQQRKFPEVVRDAFYELLPETRDRRNGKWFAILFAVSFCCFLAVVTAGQMDRKCRAIHRTRKIPVDALIRVKNGLLIGVILCLWIRLGSTLAYQTDSSVLQESVLVGSSQLAFTGVWDDLEETEDGDQKADALVKFQNSGTVGCYVRVFMDFAAPGVRERADFWRDTGGSDMVSAGEYPSHPPEGWEYIPEQESGLLGGYYYYTAELSPGEETKPLLCGVYIRGNTENPVETGDTLPLVVYAESVQGAVYKEDADGNRISVETGDSDGYLLAWEQFLSADPLAVKGAENSISVDGIDEVWIEAERNLEKSVEEVADRKSVLSEVKAEALPEMNAKLLPEMKEELLPEMKEELLSEMNAELRKSDHVQNEGTENPAVDWDADIESEDDWIDDELEEEDVESENMEPQRSWNEHINGLQSDLATSSNAFTASDERSSSKLSLSMNQSMPMNQSTPSNQPIPSKLATPSNIADSLADVNHLSATETKTAVLKLTAEADRQEDAFGQAVFLYEILRDDGQSFTCPVFAGSEETGAEDGSMQGGSVRVALTSGHKYRVRPIRICRYDLEEIICGANAEMKALAAGEASVNLEYEESEVQVTFLNRLRRFDKLGDTAYAGAEAIRGS